MPKSSNTNNIHKDVMYEARDVDASVIGWVALGAIASAFLIYGAMNLSYAYFARAEFRDVTAVTMVREKPAPIHGPLLQVDPQADLEALRQSERQVLTSYGWVDRQAGIVRIPIEVAMKRMLEKGLPPAEKPSPEQTNTKSGNMK